MITTKQPTDDMIEVAIVSMEHALVADGASLPDSTGECEQRPMLLPEPAATAAPAGQGATASPTATAVPTAPVAPAAGSVPTDPPPGT